MRTPSGEQTIEGSDILVAAGALRTPPGIGLEEAGVELDARGYIRVNDRLETTAPDVWAIGECAGSPQFTHVSGRRLSDHPRQPGRRHAQHARPARAVLHVHRPAAGARRTERARRADAGIAVRVAKLPMSAVLRTEATDETQGFMKVLVGADDDRILGFTMIGAEAGEVMAAVQTAMLADCRTRHSATPFWRTRRWPRDWDPCWKMFNRLLQPKWNNRLLQLHS